MTLNVSLMLSFDVGIVCTIMRLTTSHRSWMTLIFLVTMLLIPCSMISQENFRQVQACIQLSCHTSGQAYNRSESAQVAVVSDTTCYISMPSRRRAILVDTTGRIHDTLEYGMELNVIAMHYAPRDTALFIVTKDYDKRNDSLRVYKVQSPSPAVKVRSHSRDQYLEAYATAGHSSGTIHRQRSVTYSNDPLRGSDRGRYYCANRTILMNKIE